MKLFAIDITSWTASFRHRFVMSGIQPTLEVPPPSTIVGLINAAAGRVLKHQDLVLGYYFEHSSTAIDTELVYMRELNTKQKLTNNTRTNVNYREFLYDNYLRIYTDSPEIADYFRNPYFPLVLGRSDDLATVVSVKEVELSEIKNPQFIRGQVIPFKGNFLPGDIQNLPLAFTDEVPRQEIGLQPFTVISHRDNVNGNLKCYRDSDIIMRRFKAMSGDPVDIYLHRITTF